MKNKVKKSLEKSFFPIMILDISNNIDISEAGFDLALEELREELGDLHYYCYFVSPFSLPSAKAHLAKFNWVFLDVDPELDANEWYILGKTKLPPCYCCIYSKGPNAKD